VEVKKGEKRENGRHNGEDGKGKNLSASSTTILKKR